MKTLVLYSGGQNRRNQTLHRELVRLVRQKTDDPIRFTYIPFCSDQSKTYFMRSVRRYARFGVDEFCCLEPDQKLTKTQIRSALHSHIVYLAGGNTFYFLDALRRSGLLSLLREFSEGGGILAGLSAGAHILTPTIKLAGVKGLDPDPNEIGMKRFEALGLAPFEIFPHFDNRKREVEILRAYQCAHKRPIYALPDGAGLVVEGDQVRTIGLGIRLFSRGSVDKP